MREFFPKNPKKVILIDLNDETPFSIQSSSQRMVLLGEALIREGCRVTWIKCGFSHIRKRSLFGNQIRWLDKHFKIIHVSGVGYRRNVSIRRYLHNWVCAKQVLPLLKQEKHIDVIVCANQNVPLAFLSSRFAKERKIPFLLDIRDYCPDAYPYCFKRKILHLLIKLAIIPDQYLLKKTIQNTSGIVSSSRYGLTFAQEKAPLGEKMTRVFPLCPRSVEKLKEQTITAFSQKYKRLLERKTFRCFYSSTWGVTNQPEFLLDVAAQMQDEAVDFVICGDGEYHDRIHRKSARLSNVFLPGFLAKEEMYFLGKHCHCAIVACPAEGYCSLPIGFSNKVFLYMMCSLPLLSTYEEVNIAIKKYRLGFIFQHGDLQKLPQLIRKLKSDETLRCTMAKRVYAFYKQELESRKIYTEYAQFVKGFSK